MHITTGITLNPSKDRKEAVGQNTKWNGKLSEPPPAPLRENIQKAGTRSEFNAAGVLRKEGNEEQAFSPILSFQGKNRIGQYLTYTKAGLCDRQLPGYAKQVDSVIAT
jgi:hypothetical protein